MLLKRHSLSFNQFLNLLTPPFTSFTPVPYPTHFSPAHLFCSSQYYTFKLVPLFFHLSPLLPSHSHPRLSHHILEPPSTLFLFQFPNFNHLLPLFPSYSLPTLFYFHLSYYQVVVRQTTPCPFFNSYIHNPSTLPFRYTYKIN